MQFKGRKKYRTVLKIKYVINYILTFEDPGKKNRKSFNFVGKSVQQPTVFSEKQQIWIILKYGEVKLHTKVRQTFRLKYHKSYPVSVPHEMAFNRVVEKFKGSGDVSNPKPMKTDESKVLTHDVQVIEAYF